MAEGGGQKQIKNTLLSAATAGANFFEEAAMLIPVSLVEPESLEPATAEIDLNSDDSSSNRASVEKDFTDVLNLNDTEEVAEKVTDEPAAPISLFSGPTSSVDAFSRMLANPVKTEPATKPLGIVSSMGSFFNPVSSQTVTSPIITGPPAPTVLPPKVSEDGGQIPSASSIFASGANPASSLFTSAESNPFAPSNLSTPKTFPTPLPIASSPTPSAFATNPSSTRISTFPPSSGSVVSTTLAAPVLNPSVMPPVSTVPLISPESLPSSKLPPNVTNTSGNTFRLGSQKMKYVPCPEMQPAQGQSVPPSSQFYRPPDTVSPVVPLSSPTAAGTQSLFTPITSLDGGPHRNSPSASYQQTSSPMMSAMPANSIIPNIGAQSPPNLASVGSHNTSSYYQQPPANISPFGPQELPPLTYHWFFRKDVDGKVVWKPFSIIDSVALEDAFANDKDRLVPTDGGRYDVSVKNRLKMPVYWEETPVEVRRGSWFFKGPMDNRFVPYDEDFALKLEHEYADCMKTGVWQKRLEFPEGESVIMHSAGVVVHFCQAAAPDDWGNLPESQLRPRVVKRGVEEIEMEDGESTQIDHLVFVVHGIGPICDFKLRNIVEAVDDFRGLSIQLLNSHFRESIERNLVGRVEFLPVSWHKALHGDKGIDEQLKRITLRSIPKFRDFTNDTLLDILFYTSPVYCQTIIDSVSSELNRIHKLFLSRNPTFRGKVSLTGHSLGSLILFDLLAHQSPSDSMTANVSGDASVNAVKDGVDESIESTVTEHTEVVPLSSSARTVSYTVGTAGTGQPFITYPKIDFAPSAFFALGSPIAMFVTVRGIEKLGTDFRFPTCPAFFNIFHPYDPVAYRIETLIDPNFQSRPVLIPHHKGRKRIHLELKETMARVGADIKHRVIDAVKNTLNTVSYYTGFSKTQENLDNEIQSAIAGEMEKKSEADGAEDENAHLQIGSLNGGRRIDYVLQEAPYETFNEYVFAMSTHVGYWESEDTMLLILTEIYGTMGIQKDRGTAGTQQGAVLSPTHVPPQSSVSYALSSAMHSYQQAPAYGQGNHSSYAGAFRPSAPPAPMPEYQSVGQPPSQSYYNTSPSVSSAASSVPMLTPTSPAGGVLLPPNPVTDASKPSVIGNRPIADPAFYPRGMDPTAPMLTMTQVGPPPKAGFVPKQN